MIHFVDEKEVETFCNQCWDLLDAVVRWPWRRHDLTESFHRHLAEINEPQGTFWYPFVVPDLREMWDVLSLDARLIVAMFAANRARREQAVLLEGGQK